MSKKSTIKKQESSFNERGITLAKVAYLYGVSPDTFAGWVKNSITISELAEKEGERYFWDLRKWTPQELAMVFKAFGDPRDFQDIIRPFDIKE